MYIFWPCLRIGFTCIGVKRSRTSCNLKIPTTCGNAVSWGSMCIPINPLHREDAMCRTDLARISPGCYNSFDADYTRIGSNKGKTPEHNQAKHTKHPHSLEWVIHSIDVHMYTFHSIIWNFCCSVLNDYLLPSSRESFMYCPLHVLPVFSFDRTWSSKRCCTRWSWLAFYKKIQNNISETGVLGV